MQVTIRQDVFVVARDALSHLGYTLAGHRKDEAKIMALLKIGVQAVSNHKQEGDRLRGLIEEELGTQFDA